MLLAPGFSTNTMGQIVAGGVPTNPKGPWLGKTGMLPLGYQFVSAVSYDQETINHLSATIGVPAWLKLPAEFYFYQDSHGGLTLWDENEQMIYQQVGTNIPPSPGPVVPPDRQAMPSIPWVAQTPAPQPAAPQPTSTQPAPASPFSLIMQGLLALGVNATTIASILEQITPAGK